MSAAFFGLWLFPLGILIIKSRFIPRIIGVLLIVESIAYLAGGLTAIVLPSQMPVVSRVTAPFAAGELALIIWLLAKGANAPSEQQPALAN